MLIAWCIGWQLTLGLTGDMTLKNTAWCLIAWPMALGEYIRGKLE